MSNPANRLPPQYDDTLPRDYDPEFTASISTKMRVPETIGFSDGAGERMQNGHRANMNVPDKIVVMGQDQHAGMKTEPDLHLDFTGPNSITSHNYLGLSTPPRVLTLDDRPFPQVEDREVQEDGLKNVWAETEGGLPNGYINHTPQKLPYQDRLLEQAALATPGDGLLIEDVGEDNLIVMRKQIAKLSRHVMRIEDENAKRSQREMVLYPVVLGYFLFQVAKWLLTTK